MKSYELKIEGMTCHHCVMAVRKELSKISAMNIKEVKIGSAIVEAEESVDLNKKLSDAVEEAGYKLVSSE